jgi:N-dimethylarginine dimethylaminohydrolase
MVAPYLAARVHHLRFRAEPWFHGNTFLGFYGTTALLCEEALEPDELARLRTFLDGVRIVPIDRALSLAYATNALVVNETVLAPAGLPSFIHALWREVGLRVVELTLPALFGAGGGAAVCLTNRLDGLTLRDVPEQCHYANLRDLVVRSIA